MKAVFVFLTFLSIGYAVPKYRSFEDIDVTEYANSRNRLDKFFDCVRGFGSCEKLDANFKARGENIVKIYCEDCREKEKRITRDLFSLVASDDPFKLQVFMYHDASVRPVFQQLQVLPPLAAAVQIVGVNSHYPPDVINEFRDVDEDGVDNEYYGDYRPHSKFVKRGGIVGGVRRLQRGVLGVVGI